ncbi:MAG: hypothetical protein A2X13_05175 [Bacteroidetes bacterium GWC2_33_15]|nr:MAG: hypothetical protein A2X10_11820 [Bacteroidetes bacterium GWA2_33_15]OFX51860.1 MAG: hypothetical protein A2X13_05175 [Bacteroidetes bacterium GWC2_33_15]OFX63428.1 MAG: hypothetical protein A2X15_01450 [Bacteroidetes bacterium GWB2_32_14]OFX67224.1 MAG: hypothetical protein A2X14_01300 [Bacteroidetes bacterium GWD2_33_33]HAN17049.1 hypothetical protein [Bacteroidales bacterium]
MIRKFNLFFIFLFLFTKIFSQTGGTSTYSFLELTNSARVAAMGGNLNSVNDNDLNLTYHNPALLTAEMDQTLVLNYVNYFAGINYGYVSYARNIKNFGVFAGGIQYINYGKFIEADDKGIVTGEFNASEFALSLTYSHPINELFTVGATIKPVISTLENYTSLGISADFGALYNSPEKLFSAALVVKNLGTQLKSYTSETDNLPLNVQIGISQKLKHAPLRFSIIADHLEKPDLSYTIENNDSDLDLLTGEETSESAIDKIADGVMRHIIIGLEFMPVENLYLRAGYNYRRRQEMIIETRTAMSGFSWGFGLKISKFHINYGRATYHLAGASDHISISTNLESFYKRHESISSSEY